MSSLKSSKNSLNNDLYISVKELNKKELIFRNNNFLLNKKNLIKSYIIEPDFKIIK